MTSVFQSGNVTPGHVVTWTTDGVVQDGGPLVVPKGILGSLLGANFNSTADQAILIPSTITAFAITGIMVTKASVSMGTAAGGFYPQASKGGTAIVANTQVYSTLTSASVLLNCTVVAGALATYYTRSNVPDWAIYFSLTTPQGATATADIHLLGVDLT